MHQLPHIYPWLQHQSCIPEVVDLQSARVQGFKVIEVCLERGFI